MAIDESTVTLFLAKMSLAAPDEQALYLRDPQKYLAKLKAMSEDKKKVLASKDKVKINQAAASEQPGMVRAEFTVTHVINYSPGHALSDEIIRLIRHEIDERMGKK